MGDSNIVVMVHLFMGTGYMELYIISSKENKMTHDEIKKLDERELYRRVADFIGSEHPLELFSDVLFVCHEAEEKLDSMRLKRERGKILWKLLYGEGCGIRVDDQGFPIAMWSHIASLTRVHPIQRAQAILLTLEDTKGGG